MTFHIWRLISVHCMSIHIFWPSRELGATFDFLSQTLRQQPLYVSTVYSIGGSFVISKLAPLLILYVYMCWLLLLFFKIYQLYTHAYTHATKTLHCLFQTHELEIFNRPNHHQNFVHFSFWNQYRDSLAELFLFIPKL